MIIIMALAIRNHDPPEIEPVYIPELKYVEDSDYDNSMSIGSEKLIYQS
jgi:hypothetical protein